VDSVDEQTVASLQQHWQEGWNAGDVDVIMAPFADDVVFSSPYVSRVGGIEGRTTIDGAGALREYVETALTRSPGIHYTIDATYVGTDAVVLVYTCRYPDDRPDKAGADSMRVDADGRIVEWRCHY
jgi:hypothetical protein